MNIQFKVGDGGEGWIEKSKFSRILITAEEAELPFKLIEQMSIGGKMILPLNGRLCSIFRTTEGHQLEDLGPARFVPFVTGAAQRKR